MTKEALLATLDELKEPEFRRFKFFLRDDRIPKELVIPKNKLQDAGRCDTVDLMIEVYTTTEAVEMAQEILSKLQRNDLAQKLEHRVNENNDYD
ncbi:NACHT, LRR and PYD domains-containing protein 6-like [Halichoeres trimaculatus]|uniref:NACHT, LRR and PYD domains-containing protein 6-like n=1 Tax=Halichoeres trimaculatus TaxID=147232 RepID=UPI003D9FA95F